MLVEDITEQRLAGRALKESEARFHRIADSAPMPMWVTRLDRSRDFVNDAYVELMGVSREEALRIDWVSRIHPDDRARMIAETHRRRAQRGKLHRRGAVRDSPRRLSLDARRVASRGAMPRGGCSAISGSRPTSP